MPKQFPPGWLVLVLLLTSIGLFLVIILGTFVRLEQFSGGLVPFDGRATGYTQSDARQLLQALGDPGRAYYRDVQLWIDTLYPASYGISRSLTLLWLARPKRASQQGLGAVARTALVSLPFVVMALDYAENAGIAMILQAWPEVPEVTVAWASLVTMMKSLLGAAVDLLMLSLLAVAGWRRLRHNVAGRTSLL